MRTELGTQESTLLKTPSGLILLRWDAQQAPSLGQWLGLYMLSSLSNRREPSLQTKLHTAKTHLEA